MYTAGEWFIDSADDLEPPTIIDAGGIPVTYLSEHGDETIGNARLIKLAPQIYELLVEIMNYRQGKGAFNFSKLSSYDRDNAAYDAWESLEEQILSVLKEIEGDDDTY